MSFRIARLAEMKDVEDYLREHEDVLGAVVPTPLVTDQAPLKDYFDGEEWEANRMVVGQDRTTPITIKGSLFEIPSGKYLRSTVEALLPEKMVKKHIAYFTDAISQSWAWFCSDAGYVTVAHQDVTGNAPVMSVLGGSKIWRLSPPTAANVDHLRRGRRELLEDTVSVAVVGGETICLRPGVIHRVETTANCHGVAGIAFFKLLCFEHCACALVDSQYLYGSSFYTKVEAPKMVVPVITAGDREEDGVVKNDEPEDVGSDSEDGSENGLEDIPVGIEMSTLFDYELIERYLNHATTQLTPFLNKARILDAVKKMTKIVGRAKWLEKVLNPQDLFLKAGLVGVDLVVPERVTVYLCLVIVNLFNSTVWNEDSLVRQRIWLENNARRKVKLPPNWNVAAFATMLALLHERERDAAVHNLSERFGLGTAFTLATLGRAVEKRGGVRRTFKGGALDVRRNLAVCNHAKPRGADMCRCCKCNALTRT